MTSGVLIEISGVDASGKSTLVQELRTLLMQRGINTETVKMPSRHLFGYAPFHELVYGDDTAKTDFFSVTLSAIADRINMFRTLVAPLLARGVWVICERYKLAPVAGLADADLTLAEQAVLAGALGLLPDPQLNILTTAGLDLLERRFAERGDPVTPEYRSQLASTQAAFLREAGSEVLVIDTSWTSSPLVQALLEAIDSLAGEARQR